MKKSLKQVLKNQKSLHLLAKTRANFYDELKKAERFFPQHQTIKFQCIPLDVFDRGLTVDDITNCQYLKKPLNMEGCSYYRREAFCYAADYCYQLTCIEPGCIDDCDQTIVMYFRKFAYDIKAKIKDIENKSRNQYLIRDIQIIFDYLVVRIDFIDEITTKLKYQYPNVIAATAELNSAVFNFLFSERFLS